ncbi:ribosomal large subunit pseudouridine synthase C [Clostridiales bacterium]|nr:ribosomal large subunit pseudouridine synthase C [Clostridiales bacterium]
MRIIGELDMKEIEVTKNDSGQRIDKFLMKYFSKAPKGFVYKMLRKKRIKLNGSRAAGGEMLSEKDKIQIYLSDDTMGAFIEKKSVVHSQIKFDILYEDSNILAVNKPAGILSHGEKPGDRDTLIDQIQTYLFEKGEYVPSLEQSFVPALCNRLDRNTSGIVLAGKTAETLRQANGAVKNRLIIKKYKALIAGRIENSGILEDFYKKDCETNKAVLGDGNKRIITKYNPIKTKGEYSLVELELVTGRSHQLRVHMASKGWPIVGDTKYGDQKVNRYFRQLASVKRQLLHAYWVELGGFADELEYLNGMKIISEIPKDFKGAEKLVFENIQKA